MVLLLAVAAIMIAIGVYIIGKVRGEVTDNTPESSNLMSKFQDLHSQGELSDEEYRTIKGKLAEQLQRELRDNSKAG